MPEEVFKSIESKEITISDGKGAGFVKTNSSGVMSGGNDANLNNIVNDILPGADNTYSLGSQTKKWAFVYATVAVLSSIIVGAMIGIEDIDGTLFINASTIVNGSFVVNFFVTVLEATFNAGVPN